MHPREVFRLIASGALQPEVEVALELGIAPVKLTVKGKTGDFQKLMIETKTVSEVVRRCYVQRQILHKRFSGENRDDCAASAKEIVEELRRVQAGLPGAGPNALLVELLGNWEDISVDAQQKLQGSAPLIDILREYRVKSLRIIEALVAMLPPDARTRHDAEEKIKETRRSLPSPDLALISDARFVISQGHENVGAIGVPRPSASSTEARTPPVAEAAKIEGKNAEEHAKMLLDKGSSLGLDYHKEEAIAVYDDLIARFGSATETPLREYVAKALGWTELMLWTRGREKEANAIYADLIARFGFTDTPLLKQFREETRQHPGPVNPELYVTAMLALRTDI
jgi:hypothetical protein